MCAPSTAAAAVAAEDAEDAGSNLEVSSPDVPPGWGFNGDCACVIRCCIEDVGAVVDSVVVSFPLATEVAGEIAVGICVDGSPVERTLVFDRLKPRDLRNRSRFLGFSPDILENLRHQVRLVGWVARIDFVLSRCRRWKRCRERGVA